MKKWIILILLCVLLGIVTTVAVAWGLGGLTEWDSAASYYDSDDEPVGEKGKGMMKRIRKRG